MNIVNLTFTPDGRVNRAGAASYLGVAAKTLANWAFRGLGPRSVKIGGRRFYYVADLEAFIGRGEAT
jgi:hypothetical protein